MKLLVEAQASAAFLPVSPFFRLVLYFFANSSMSSSSIRFSYVRARLFRSSYTQLGTHKALGPRSILLLLCILVGRLRLRRLRLLEVLLGPWTHRPAVVFHGRGIMSKTLCR